MRPAPLLVVALIVIGGLSAILAWAFVGGDGSGGGGGASGPSGAYLATPPDNPCPARPTAVNTGPPPGTSLTPHPGGEIRQGNAILDGQEFSGLVTIYAKNVTIRNSVAAEGIVIAGSDATIDHVRTRGIGINTGDRHVIRYTEISGGADQIHIDSSAMLVSDVTVESSYLHDPNPQPDAHFDAMQVRGVSGLQVSCSDLDLGPYESTYNAAIYLEWVAVGNRDVTIDHNWINGGGFAVYVDAENLRITNNRFGRDAHWAPCNNDRRNSGGGVRPFVSKGNVWDDTGAPLNLCGQG